MGSLRFLQLSDVHFGQTMRGGKLRAPAAIAVYALTGWLIAMERTSSVFWVQLAMNGLNIALDLWFVLGLGWGVEGVAIATFLAEWSGLALGLGEVRGQEAQWESGRTAREVTLTEALSLARENAPALEQRLSQLEVSKYGELTAWGQFLPDLSLSYQYNNSSSGRLDPTGQTITTTSYSAGGTSGNEMSMMLPVSRSRNDSSKLMLMQAGDSPSCRLSMPTASTSSVIRISGWRAATMAWPWSSSSSRPRSKPASPRSAPRSRKPPRTTTVRSCKSALPNWQAVLP